MVEILPVIGVLAVDGHQYDNLVGTVLLIAVALGACYTLYRLFVTPKSEPGSSGEDQVGAQSNSEDEPPKTRANDKAGSDRDSRHSGQRERSETDRDRARSAMSSDDRRYGKILGLRGQVTRAQITRRYKELAGQYHPDRVNHLGPKLREVAESEMKAINEAYEYFRKRYDLG